MLELTLSDDVTARLEAGAKAAVDFTVPMAAIADLMRSETVLNFETETGPDGERWLPSQRAIDDGGLTLTEHGHLRQSVTAASDANSAINGTNMIYARIHQEGGAIRGRASSKHQNTPKPRVIVARPFIGFGPGLVSDIELILVNHIDAALGGAA